MNLQSIRQNVATAVQTAAASYADFTVIVEYDNRYVVDTQTQLNPFVTVETNIRDGLQADLADSPIHRIIGDIVISVAVKKGDGRAKADKLLEHMYKALHAKNLSGVRTHYAAPRKEVEHLGWCYYPAIIPFWCDIIY